MPTTFHLSKHFRNIAVVGIVFSATMVAVFLVTVDFDEAWAESRIWKDAFPAAIFVAFLLISIYLLLAYLRSCVVIDEHEQTIATQGLFSKRTLCLGDVSRIVWRRWPAHGSVRLIANDCRLTLDLGGFPPTDQLEMIRFVRRYAAADSQQDWQTFCHRIALPLSEGRQLLAGLDIMELPESARVLATRQRWDRICLWLAVLSAAAVVLIWLTFGLTIPLPQALLLCLGLIVLFWLLVRFSIPLSGQWQLRLSGDRDIVTMLICGAIVVTLVLPTLFLPLLGVPESMVTGTVVLLGLAGLAAMLYFARRIDNRNEITPDKLRQSVERWNAQERALAEGPADTLG